MAGVEKYKTRYTKYINFINKYRKSINAATGSEVDSNANVENVVKRHKNQLLKIESTFHQ